MPRFAPRLPFHAAGLLLALASATPALALEPVHRTLFGVAIGGTDPVAYFTEGRPVKGAKAFSLEWNGATWRFASAENRERFRADPERFAPQYGGYCAWAVGHGYTASSDPEAWSIVGGKLYLNYDRDVQALWTPDRERWIEAGDRSWPALRDGGGR